MKKFASLLEITLMIVSIIAFAFLINPHEIVSAQTTNNVCCEKSAGGAWCQDLPSDQCDKQFLSSPTSCDATSFCRLGCCYDSQEGLCMKNTPQRVCQEGNGTWSDSTSCDVPQCSLGCCVLGIQAAFVTLTRCKQLSSFYNLETDFRKNIGDELTCLSLASVSDEGACVFEVDFSKTCKFTTRQECNNIAKGLQEANGTVTSNATFFKDYLCSSEELATNCGPTTRTACKPGRDEVYFIDSCGNPANIYDSSKVNDKAYWNKIVKKEASCGAGNSNGNANSKSCGNCDYFYGSVCSSADRNNRATYGDYICQNLNCRLADGTTKRSGESWCYQDTPSGKTDSVGSRYFRHICINGEELVEPCADFRQKVCIEGSIDIGGQPFSQAGCVVNRWQDCVMQITKDDCLNTDKRDCKWITTAKEEDVTANSTACVAIYAPGFEFWNDAASAGVCSIGSTSCKVEFTQGSIADITNAEWSIDKGKSCVQLKSGKDGTDTDDWEASSTWTAQQNAICNQLGDCGGKVNFVNVYSYSEGYNTSITSALLIPLIQFAQIASYAALKVLGGGGLTSAGPVVPPIADPTSPFTASGGPSAASRLAASELGRVPQGTAPTAAVPATPAAPPTAPAPTTPAPQGPAAPGGGTTPSTTTPWWQNYWVKGVVNGFIAYGMAKMIFGYVFPDDENLANSLSEAIGIGVAIATWVAKGNSITWANGGGVGLAIGVIYFLATYEREEIKYVHFECLPWEPPIGGKDCEKCNSDIYPCTEYRCKSLGQACQILNEGTTNQQCAWVNPGDVISPVISPFENVLTAGYKYVGEGVRPPARGVEIQRSEGGKCIKAFTPITFGVTTDEPTQCKIEYNHTTSFANMTFYVGGSNNYAYNHTQLLRLPGPANLNNQGIVIQNNGQYEMFIRCQDSNGNANADEYVVKFCVEAGPDVTPPIVESSSILNGMPVKYNANQTALDIYVNEPAECKWSRLDQSYDSMENTFSCATKVEEMNANMLYTCSSTLTGLRNSEDNVYYFRCRDQPTGVETQDRNTNQNSYKFILKGTKPLDIVSVGPNGTATGSTTLVPVYLEVETDNGYNLGDANCFYSLTNNEEGYVKMFTTGTNKHSQRQDLVTGSYTYYFKCVDLGGNTDYSKVSFNVYVDQQPPQIVRIYDYEDKLTIITDQKSDCSYQTNDQTACNFNLDEGINMPYSDTTEHSTEWQVGKTFYIKCRDESGNEPAPSECTSKVKTTRS